jgi:hypothetical protein
MSAPDVLGVPASITRFALSIYDSDLMLQCPEQDESACCRDHCRERPAQVSIDAHGRGYGVWIAPRPLVDRAPYTTAHKAERIATLTAGLAYPRAAFDPFIEDADLHRYACALNMHDGVMRKYTTSMVAKHVVSMTVGNQHHPVIDPALVEWFEQPIFTQLSAYSEYELDMETGIQEEWETGLSTHSRYKLEVAAIITLHPDAVAHVNDRLDAYFAVVAARFAAERVLFDVVHERASPFRSDLPSQVLTYRTWKQLYFDADASGAVLPSTMRTRVMCAADWVAHKKNKGRNGVAISDIFDWREFQYDLHCGLSGNNLDSDVLPWDADLLEAQLRMSVKCADIIRARAPEFYIAICRCHSICSGVLSVHAAEKKEQVAIHTLAHGVLPCLEDDTNLIPDLIAIIGRYAAGTHGVKSVMTPERDALRVQRRERDAIAVATRDAARQLESANAESLADATGEDASRGDQGRACKRQKL